MRRFFKGGWLEAFIYVSLDKHKEFEDLMGRVVVKEIKNELDVICTYKGKMGIIEAKTGSFSGKDNLEKRLSVSKLMSLKNTLLGKFGKTILVSDQYKNDMDSNFKLRAECYEVPIIYFDQLPMVADEVFKIMAEKRN